MTALPALSSVDTPPPALRKLRAKSIQKNVSERTRQSREIRLVDEDDERPTSLTPSTFREAKYTCELCGGRSVGKVHPIGEASGIPVCQEPPQMWERRKNGAR